MKHRRSGFSLIELLVVMTIIGIMAALILGTGMGAFGAGRIAATRTTIAKLDSILKQQMEALSRRPMKNSREFLVASYQLATPPNSPSTISEAVAEAYLRKILFRSTFPQRLEDLYGMDGTPNTPDDAILLSEWLQKTGGVLFPPGHNRAHESAKLLCLALTSGKAGDEILDGVNPRHIAYLDPSDKAMGLPAFIDDWGNALRFYNFPTRLVRPGGFNTPITQSVYNSTAKLLTGIEIPASPSPIPFPTTSSGVANLAINQDPTDPGGRLAHAVSIGVFANPFRLRDNPPVYRRSPANSAPPYEYLTFTCAAVTEATFHTPLTFHQPLLISCGEDGQLGLEEPSTNGPGRLAQPKTGEEELIADDITNLQRRT